MFTKTVLMCLALLAMCTLCSASTGKFSTCCTKVSAAKPKPGIVLENFIIQKADLPCVHAVMFFTNEGRIICSTPTARWVKAKMQEINKKREKEKNEQEITEEEESK